MPISEVAPEEPSKERTTGSVWLLNLDMIESNTGKIVGKVYEKDSNLLSVAPFDEGNVLYSKLRPYLNKVVIPNEKGYATTELVPLRPKQELLNLSFFSHLLRSDDFVAYANGIATGTKMPRMPLNDLRKFNCILPPIEMQREFELIAHQADKSGFDGRKSRFIEMFKSTDYVQLNSLVTLSKSSIMPQDGSIYTLYSFPAYDNNQTPEIVDGREIKSSKIVLEENVVLFNKLNVRLSRVWNIHCLSTKNNICSSEFLPLKVKNSSVISQSFLYRILCSDYVTKKMMDCSTGTSNSQKRITPSSLMNMSVPLPSIDEQQKFVAIANQADKSVSDYYIHYHQSTYTINIA